MPQRTQHSGLTLLELLVTVVILTVLLTLGLPAMSRLLQDNYLNSAVLQTKGVLQLARARALQSGQAVGVCSSQLWPICSAVASSGDAWTAFLDYDGDRQPSPTDEIIKVREWPSGALTVRSSRKQPIFFDPLGAAGSNTTLRFCLADGTKGYKLVLANSGRVRTVPIDCNDAGTDA